MELHNSGTMVIKSHIKETSTCKNGTLKNQPNKIGTTPSLYFVPLCPVLVILNVGSLIYSHLSLEICAGFSNASKIKAVGDM